MANSTKILYPLFYLASHLPMGFMYLLSDICYITLYYVVGYRRKMVKKNLIKVFPDKSNDELKIIEKKFYKHLCDIMFEAAKSLTMKQAEFQCRLKITNAKIFNEYFEQGKSIIIYTGHYGNWEWFSILPLSIPHQFCGIYQPLSNKLFDTLVRANRERFGAIAIKSASAFKSLNTFSNNKQLTATLVIGDQRPSRHGSSHWVKFLNQESAFSVGADRIAKKLDQVVVFPHFKKVKRGYYEVDFQIITDNAKEIKSEEIIENYARLLEAAIIESPEMWLWSHNRWKYARNH